MNATVTGDSSPVLTALVSMYSAHFDAPNLPELPDGDDDIIS